MFGGEFVAGQVEALQFRSGLRFGLTQRSQRLGRMFPGGGGGGDPFGEGCHDAVGLGQLGAGFGALCLGGFPAVVQYRRFGLAQVVGDVAVALRLPRLFLEIGKLGFQRGQDVVEPRQIGFGATQAEFGLVAPGMQAGDPGCFFQQHTPGGWLGVD